MQGVKVKVIDSLSCGTAVIGTDVAFEGITDFPGLFKEAIEMCKANSLNLPAAIFAEGAHLKSDEFTKLGLPVPVLETINPDFASKLYKSNYDALCFFIKNRLSYKSYQWIDGSLLS